MIKLHPQIRSLVITIATVVSSLAALLVFVVIGFSEKRAIAVFWSADQKRHEILIDRGSILLHTLRKYQFKTKGAFPSEVQRGRIQLWFGQKGVRLFRRASAH